MISVDPNTLISIGQQYGIPPALLYGMAMSGNLATAGLQAEAYGFTPGEIQSNPALAVQLMGVALRDNFQKYGNLEEAISAFASGDPQAYQSVTSPVGGFVTSALAVAASNADLGLTAEFGQRMDPRGVALWSGMGRAFGKSIDGFVHQGGVITAQMAHRYQQGMGVASQALAGRSDINTDVKSNLSYPIAKFDAHPFDAGFLGSETENFGMQPSGFGQEVGNDFGMPTGQKMMAAMGGTVTVRNFAGKLDTFITVTDGPMKGWQVGYGHLSNVNVHDGQVVKPGEVIGLSGGAVGDPNAGNSSGPHLEFQLRDPSGRFHDPQPLLEATLGRRASMAPGPYGGADEAKPPDPDVASIDKFAARSKAAGLTPGSFDRSELYSTLHRRHGLPMGDIEDYAKTANLNDTQMGEHIANKPHPTYPEVPVGEFNRVRDAADMYGMVHAQRTASGPEVLRLLKAGGQNQTIKDYFASQQDPKNQRGALS